MILKDKPYIKTPNSNTPLIHYLNIYQLLSILKYKKLFLSTVGSYNDREEATLTLPSYEKVKQHLLWEDNTPIKKEDTGYIFRRGSATKSRHRTGQKNNQKCFTKSTGKNYGRWTRSII